MTSLIGIALALALVVSTAYAADRQEKAQACHAEAAARKLKGHERKTFMSECSRAKPAMQEDTATTCKNDASEKGLKGDERKAFIRECLTKG